MSQGKEIIVVGGPNGAGKTTLALKLLADSEYFYLSADEIAQRLNPHNPSAHRVAAGRIFIEQIEKTIDGDASFLIESTLSGKLLMRRLGAASAAGFEITIVFIFLDSADMCVQRVRERVRKGGHDVPDSDVRRRFPRSLSNFWKIYRQIADHWLLAYNSSSDFHDVAIGTADTQHVRDSERFRQFLKLAGVASIDFQED